MIPNEILAVSRTVPRLHSVIGRAAVALIAFLPLAAGAQNGPVPGYISSMSPFQVRGLDGAFAPTNGNVSMEDVTPAEWLTNDPSVLGLNGVLAAWSGGAKGGGTRLFVHGGGHTDSANNGMYIYDFAGQNNPTGWQAPLVVSAVADVRDGAAVYADGKPNSVHTYDGIVYASHNNHVYRFGGSRYSSGRLTRTAFKFNASNGVWTRLPDYPGGEDAAKTIYDPVTGNIFVTMTDEFDGYFLRTDTDTWSSRIDYNGNGFPFDSMAAWDSSRNRAIVVGEGETSVVNVDFEAETVTVQSFSPTGDTGLYGRSGISAVYDPVRDVYWLFGGGTGSPGYTGIYELRAGGDPWTTIRHDLTGDSIPLSKGLIGSWGRYVLMPQWGAIGFVAHEGGPAFVIKLPDDPFVTPEAPANLQVN